MRLVFVYYAYNDAGSAQDIDNYAQAAEALGHEVAVYGLPDPESRLRYSLDVDSADALIFIFEWTTQLRRRRGLDFARLVARVPRRRRVVIDCDGNYNDVISIE